MVVQVERTCPTSVTTKSGTFTFFPQYVPRCKAEQFCHKLGQILAPVTNIEDRWALQEIADQKCGIFVTPTDIPSYHIGLNNHVCGGEVTRVFTNGVAWNEKVHSKLYYITKAKSNCYATLWTPFNGFNNRIGVYTRPENCSDFSFRFICLAPAKNENSVEVTEVDSSVNNSVNSEALIFDGENVNQLTVWWQLAGFCVLASVCFLLNVNRLLNKKNKNLSLDNDSLKGKIEFLEKFCTAENLVE